MYRDFYLNNDCDYKALMSSGFLEVSLRRLKGGWPHAVVFRRTDGTGVMLRNRMFDVSPDFEIGVADLSITNKQYDDEVVLECSDLFKAPTVPEKVMFEDEDVIATVGLKFNFDAENKIMIVGGSVVCTLAIFGAGLSGHDCEPDFPIDERYRTEPWL